MAIGGPGVPLPFPTNPYPTPIAGISASVWSNAIYLLAGQRWTLPPGRWVVTTASTTQTVVQFLDPVSGQWVPVLAPASGSRAYWHLNSDGANYRVSNLFSTLTGAAVTAAGTGYVQASTTVTAGTGISTWQPVIGGAITSITIGNDKNGVAGGTNFTMAPILVVQAPPVGGVQATASCTVAAGAIATITVRAAGAGYTSAPGVLVIPDPADPTLGAITIPALTAVVGGAGTLTAVLLVNPGLPVTTAPTLTVNGVGSAATATATLFSASTTADTIYVQWLGSGG